MIELADGIEVPDEEIAIHAIRAQGAGGQNVNKVSSAVHLRFDIGASSLSPELRAALAALSDQRISDDGVIVIKAQRFRSLDRNREDALERLRSLVARALSRPAPRIATRPGPAAKRRRLDAKSRRAGIKAAHTRVRTDE